ncbi:hypothetical protein FoTM2_013488 [Fusarium oxysporum f. sp. vasinfectum]|nr:hypothetical protein FoTM2_013488 [Fusarium oxysporum f. sp. vasinfectum]
MSKRKRSLSVREDNCAEFPFTISYETSDSPAHQKGHKNKKRKYDGQDENNRAQSQISPFNPKGSFKTPKNKDRTPEEAEALKAYIDEKLKKLEKNEVWMKETVARWRALDAPGAQMNPRRIMCVLWWKG